MITLYNIPSKTEGNPWNLSAWKARYTLNYKGISYQTVWIEYPDIEKVYKEVGAEPTSKKADGSPLYTVPFIRDDSTGVAVSDSLKITEYLDKTYPDTPKAVPMGTHALIKAFVEAFMGKQKPIFPFLVPKAVWQTNPASEEYLRRTRMPIFGEMEDLIPQGEQKVVAWKQVEEGWASIDAWMDKDSVFVIGDVISFADFAVGGMLMCMRQIYGRDSDEWKDMTSWQGGRWARLMQELEKYETVV